MGVKPPFLPDLADTVWRLALLTLTRTKTMSKDGYNLLIDTLKKVDDSENSILGFDMNLGFKDKKSSAHDCGSACCIGGWCQKMLIDGGASKVQVLNRSLEDAFQKITGSDYETAYAVCWPEYNKAYKASLAAAIHMLEELRDGAEVDWRSAMDMYGESEHIHE